MRLRHISTLLLLVAGMAAQNPPAPKPPTTATETTSALIAEWRTPPQLNVNAVKGSLVVINQTDDDFDQTVIIEAINETGKAFTLGYQHFALRRQATSPVIPFGTTLPPGNYTIRADAVAEVPARHAIHRASLVAAQSFVVTAI
jgi:hypothetical protein